MYLCTSILSYCHRLEYATCHHTPDLQLDLLASRILYDRYPTLPANCK